MSKIRKITVHQVIDSWHELELAKQYIKDPNRVQLCIKDVFADNSLKIVSGTVIPDKLRVRYTRIVEKLKQYKTVSTRSKYHGFDDPEKLFFDENEFQNLCEKDGTTR